MCNYLNSFTYIELVIVGLSVTALKLRYEVEGCPETRDELKGALELAEGCPGVPWSLRKGFALELAEGVC